MFLIFLIVIISNNFVQVDLSGGSVHSIVDHIGGLFTTCLMIKLPNIWGERASLQVILILPFVVIFGFTITDCWYFRFSYFANDCHLCSVLLDLLTVINYNCAGCFEWFWSLNTIADHTCGLTTTWIMIKLVVYIYSDIRGELGYTYLMHDRYFCIIESINEKFDIWKLSLCFLLIFFKGFMNISSILRYL